MTPQANARGAGRRPQRSCFWRRDLGVVRHSLATVALGLSLWGMPLGRTHAQTVTPPSERQRASARPEQTRRGTKADNKRPRTSQKLFDFTGLKLAGNMRMPQLLYFLERANEELERASLERRSFLPELVRSIDEAQF